MKTAKKLLTIVAAILTISAVSVTAFAADDNFGSAGVEENRTYTLSEMLTYAIQDEYLAQAEYEKIIGTFGEQRPFTNIIKAEATHIAELEPLFEEYGTMLPENTAKEYVAVPASVLDAYTASAEAEVKNIAMYEAFLKQELPDDVRAVFTALKHASENHLTAFERAIAHSDGGAAGLAENQRRQSGGRNR